MAGDPLRPSALVTVGLSLMVLAGDLFTAFLFGFACAVGDTTDEQLRSFCESPLPLAPWLGAVAVTTGAVVAHVRRSYTPWKIGASLGVACGLALWVLMGDPAGNFRGILR